MTDTVNNSIPFVPENTIDPAAGLNLSLNTVDALLQVLVQTVDLNTPPAGVEGQRFIVGTAPTGAWAGQANKLARFLDGAWQFFDARHVLNAADGLWYVRRSSSWSALVGSAPTWGSITGTLSAQTDLQSALDAKQPTLVSGTNIKTLGGVSVLGAGDIPVSVPNLLINGDFSINQRAFAGGARSAGVYGHDRWGAYNGGADWSVSAGVVTLTSGVMCQVIESPGIAGREITISVEDPSGTINVTLGNGTGSSSIAGSITAGSGRRGVTLLVPAAVTGDLKVRLAATAVTFKRVKLELGAAATPYVSLVADEFQRCTRYWSKSFPYGTTPVNGAARDGAAYAQIESADIAPYGAPQTFVPLAPKMRSAPAITLYTPDVASPTGSFRMFPQGGGATTLAANTVFVSDGGFIIYSASSPGAKSFCYIHWAADAEILCTD